MTLIKQIFTDFYPRNIKICGYPFNLCHLCAKSG